MTNRPATAPVNPRRVRVANARAAGPGPVVYWMHRDHRARDNWGLLYARQLARQLDQPLAVAYGLAPRFLDATLRQFGFLLRGLERAAQDLEAKGLPFFLLRGNPPEVLLDFCARCGAGAVVTDFDPLRVKRGWVHAVAEGLGVGVWEVDSRNIVPCWAASDKQEWAARTIRPKIHRLLPEFQEDFPELEPQRRAWAGPRPSADLAAEFADARKSLQVDRSVAEVDWLAPGEAAAAQVLDDFIARKLPGYAHGRNDPTKDFLSNLSPYLHFGMISSLRVALRVAAARGADADNRDAFLEELIVRRELSDNFCAHNPRYDEVPGFPDWARTTLGDHRADRRQHLYAMAELEQARTHDPLWNAAQMEMVARGKMHGYMRMYWAKKILEWSPDPEAAMAAAIRLNDRYELDGRDSNGYVGVAWSIGGVHDRAWQERPVFGKVRYMSAAGAASKFDVKAYAAMHSGAGRRARGGGQ